MKKKESIKILVDSSLRYLELSHNDRHKNIMIWTDYDNNIALGILTLCQNKSYYSDYEFLILQEMITAVDQDNRTRELLAYIQTAIKTKSPHAFILG